MGTGGMYADTLRRVGRGPEDDPVQGENPTLTNTAGHCAANIAKSHEMADQIELALFGPAPGQPSEKANSEMGLMDILGGNASGSASLAHRLEQIASRIGQRHTR